MRINRIFFRHLLWWLFFTGVQSISMGLKFGYSSGVDQVLYFLILIMFFYAVYYVVFRSYQKNGRIWQAVLSLLLICVMEHIITVWFVNNIFIGLLHREAYRLVAYSNTNMIIDNLNNSVEYILYAYMYWQSVKAVDNERKFRIAETQNLSLQNEKLQTEYNYLKSQINPHFLYNTLDYFYAHTLRHDKKTAEGIATLSEIMRYSLNSGDIDGRVLLEEETFQVENYISLQQLRYNHGLQILFEQEDIPPGKIRILPHLLITLVENAFKHGITDDPANPVSIRLSLPGNRLVFEVMNVVSREVKDHTDGGIGLKNLRDRLQIEYADQGRFETGLENGVYTARIYITIL
jgi:two-component system, LytTR family, sensor kinase